MRKTVDVYGKGENYYSWGSGLIKLFLASLALMFLVFIICLIGWGIGDCLLVLAVQSYYGFINFITVLCYLGLIVGSIGFLLFFLGIHYMALGEIANNTENASLLLSKLAEEKKAQTERKEE